MVQKTSGISHTGCSASRGQKCGTGPQSKLLLLGWYLVANGSGQHIGVSSNGAVTHGCLSFEDWLEMLSGTSVPTDKHEQRNNSEKGTPQILLIYRANATPPSVLSKTYASL
jgi:hypothetical protein